jgi:hypothetical protein
MARHLEVDVLQRVELPVVKIEVLELDLRVGDFHSFLQSRPVRRAWIVLG